MDKLRQLERTAALDYFDYVTKELKYECGDNLSQGRPVTKWYVNTHLITSDVPH